MAEEDSAWELSRDDRYALTEVLAQITRLFDERRELLEASRFALENITGVMAGDDIPSMVVRDKLNSAIIKAVAGGSK